MNYETAKALKDAGFVQDLPDPSSYYATGYTNSPKLFGWSEGEDKPSEHGGRGYVKVPTLEELVEAVTEEQNRGMFLLAFEKNTWSAQLNDYSRIFVEDCSTPTEAVALLWLALNKKQQSG